MATDLVGLHFGRLTVIKASRQRSEGRSIIWICQCDCGNFTNVPTPSLTSGNTQSCGCYQRQRVAGLKYKHGEAAFNKVFAQYKLGAKNRELSFSLNRKEFQELTQQKCHYCNSGFSNLDTYGSRSNGGYSYNGIDRIDNNKGYEIDNCVPCCTRCNRAKRESSYKDFINWLNQVSKFRKEGN